MTDTRHELATDPDSHPRPGALERMTGPTVVVTAVVLAASSLLQGLTDPGDGPAEAAFAQTPTHLTSAVISLLSFALVALSVVLLQVRQRGGVPSTVITVLAFLFSVAAAGGEFTDAFIDPTIAQIAPTLYGGDSPPALVEIGFGVAFTGVGLFVGVYGIVLAVMGRVARVGAILVALGALGTAAPGDYGNWISLLVAVGLAWIGLTPIRPGKKHTPSPANATSATTTPATPAL